MTVYASEFVRGKVQELQYGSSTARVFIETNLAADDIMPTGGAASLYDQSGNLLATCATASIAMATPTNEGWVTYASASSQFNLGAKITGSSSGFTGYIRAIQHSTTTSGRMFLTSVIGAPDAEPITDDGDTAGSASIATTSFGAFYSGLFYSTFDISASTYGVGENYRVKWTVTYASVDHTINQYVDIVYDPIKPLTLSRAIDAKHPDWISMRPKEYFSWVDPIRAGHAEMCRRIRLLGGRPAFIVKREELEPIEMAFVEAEIAKSFLAFPKEDRDRWIANAEEVWDSRGEFSYAAWRDDGMIDDKPVVFSSSLTR